MRISDTIEERFDEAVSRQQIEKMTQLVESTIALSNAFDFEKIMQLIVDESAKLFECEQVRLFHYDRKRDELHMDINSPDMQHVDFRRHVSLGIRGEVASSRQLQRVIDPPAHTQWCGELDHITGVTTRNLLAAPLILPSDESLFGVLELLNKYGGSFEENDEALLNMFLKHASAAIDRARYVQEIREQHELDASLGAAREIQRRFMSNKMPALPGYEVATWWLPNETVGGDYCDVIPLVAGKLGLCVADVSGHGLGPSLLMASVRAALHALVLEHSSPQVLMEMVSRSLMNDLHFSGFITMILASLDYQTHQVDFSNAGHAPALHYSAKTRTFSSLEASGPPLGVVDEPHLPLGPPIAMKPGDWLVLCTDGIVEAIDPNEIQFGYERLQAIVEKNKEASAQELVLAIGRQVEQHFIEDHPQDDLTILALRRNS